MDLKSKIRIVEDFPQEGISFKDITTLLNDQDAFRYTIDQMMEYLKDKNITAIAAPEARGFLFGAAVAYGMGIRFIPVRKPGKLPFKSASYSYDLEYGCDTLEVHQDAVHPNDRIAIVDDLLATGGTIYAAAKLLEQQGAEIAAMTFLIELEELEGRQRNKEYDIMTLVRYKL